MKENTHSVRQLVLCCISTFLTAMLAVMTVLPPERVPLAPLLAAMLLRPALLLVTAGVNFSCLKTGVRALCTGKPDRHAAAVLTVLLALVLFAGMTASNELLPLWAALIVNTLLGCVYVAYLFKHDFSPSSLPVVGKYFKAGKR